MDIEILRLIRREEDFEVFIDNQRYSRSQDNKLSYAECVKKLGDTFVISHRPSVGYSYYKLLPIKL